MRPTEPLVALIAGFVSFLAPCVLPLVPGYLSAVSAVEADRLNERGSARRVVLASIPFVLGFTGVFVALGIGAQLIGGRILSDQFLLEQIAGFVLVVFGLAFMGLLPWPERLVGAGLVQGARSRGSRVLLGGAFAICAAPCIGPVLAAILVLAGTSDTVLQGAFLLACYSLGLAIPFVSPVRFSHVPWGRSVGSGITTSRSSSSAARSWSPSGCCSSSAASTTSGSTSTAPSSGSGSTASSRRWA